MTTIYEVDLSLIRLDGSTQARAALNTETVEDYAEAVRAGNDLPPVVVFFDGQDYWLADGFHRVAAYRAARAETIPAEVHDGTRLDAIEHACGANARHGLPRSAADKRRAVTLYLTEVYPKKDPRPRLEDVARACGVSVGLVHKVRAEMEAEATFHREKLPGKVRAEMEAEATFHREKLPGKTLGSDGKQRPTKYKERRAKASSSGDGPRAPVTGGPQRPPPEPKVPPPQGTDAPPREPDGEVVNLTPTPEQAEARALDDLKALDPESQKAIEEAAARIGRAAKQMVNALSGTGLYIYGTAVSTDHRKLRLVIAALGREASQDLSILADALEHLTPTIRGCRKALYQRGAA